MWTLKDSFYFFLLVWAGVSILLTVVNLFLKKNLKEIDKGLAMKIISEAGTKQEEYEGND